MIVITKIASGIKTTNASETSITGQTLFGGGGGATSICPRPMFVSEF
jgi:hypothetical protein